MNSKFIVIDGQTYKSVDEMPTDVRQKYEAAMQKLDQNQNGIPDMLENLGNLPDSDQDGIPDVIEKLAALKGKMNVKRSTKIRVNGQIYDSLDQLPPDLRAKYEQAMGALDQNHNGIPDFMEGMLNNQPSQNAADVSSNMADVISPIASSSPNPFSTPQTNPIPANSVIEPESTGGRLAVLTGIVLIGMCLLIAAAGVWYFFLR